jgi:hypothetical protein
MIATVKTAFVEVCCAKCGRPERLTPQHVDRLKANNVEWTCRAGTGCDLVRTNKPTTQQEKK